MIPDGRYLPTRLLAVLHHEDGAWKVAAMHFSVAVADEDALRDRIDDAPLGYPHQA